MKNVLLVLSVVLMVSLLPALPLAVFPSWVLSQDDEPTYTVSVWLVTFVDEAGEPLEEAPREDGRVKYPEDALPLYVGFIQDNATGILISDFDTVYTPTGEGTYAATLLVETRYLDYSGSLTVIDENTMLATDIYSNSVRDVFVYFLLERVDEPYTIYRERERELTEYSQFAACLGQWNAEPPPIYLQLDPLVLIRANATELEWNQTLYQRTDDTYSRESTMSQGRFKLRITEVFRFTGPTLTYTYHAIADERDDCELIYVSYFTPFEGDFAELFAAAEALSDVE